MKTDILNIGIIGAGKFSHRHVGAIKQLKQCRLIAACRSSAPDLHEFCSKYQIKGYQDYRKLLMDPDIDAVLISTPHHLHSEMAVDAARAGKHILLEKPFAPTLDECQHINDESKKAGIKLMVGHTGRFSDCFKETKRLIHSEELGSLIQAISFSNTLWMGPDRKDWHLKKDFGGGYMLTLAVHQIDAILNLVDVSVSGCAMQTGNGISWLGDRRFWYNLDKLCQWINCHIGL